MREKLNAVGHFILYPIPDEWPPGARLMAEWLLMVFGLLLIFGSIYLLSIL